MDLSVALNKHGYTPGEVVKVLVRVSGIVYAEVSVFQPLGGDPAA